MRKGKNRVCNICSKLIQPRGMGGHMRLAHGITVKTIVKNMRNIRGDVPGDVCDIRDLYLQRPNNDLKKSVETVETNIEPDGFEVPSPKIRNVSNVAGKDLSECVRLDGQHSYTETDIKILLAKLIYHVYFSLAESQLLDHFVKMDLIEDFEKRFNCTFRDITKANSNIQIQMGETDKEHIEFMNKYVHLKYSR